MAINWERHLLKAEGKLGSVHSLLGPSEFVKYGVFVTKKGHLGCVVKLSPVSFEGKDPAEMESITAGFIASLYSLDQTMRVYQHVCKDHAPEFEYTHHTPRIEYLESVADSFYGIDTYLSVVYELPAFKSSDAAEIDRQLQIEAGYLISVVSALIGGWAGLKGALLDQRQAFSFLTWLVNYDPRLRNAEPVAAFDIDWQLAQSNIDANGALRVGTSYVRILTLKDLPAKSTTVFMLRDLLTISCGMVASTEWRPVGYSDAHKAMRVNRRHINNTKTSLTSGGRVVDGGKEYRDEMLETAQKEMEKGQHIGEFSLTIALYSEDPAVLRKAVSSAHSVFQMKQGALLEQHGRSALVAWFGMVPGNAHFSVRHRNLFEVNYGDLSFLFGAATGAPQNKHFRDDALVVLQNTHGQPHYLNLHDGEVGHSLFTGRTGSGKTFVTSLLIDNAQKYPGVRTIVFDIMNGYRLLTERLGGTYIQLGGGERGATINPFAGEPTEDNTLFLNAFVRLLIESDGGERLTNYELLDLDNKIRGIYRLSPSLRRLGSLMLTPTLMDRLNRWVTRHSQDRTRVGIYAHLFDNEVDSISLGRFVTFNFPNMQEDHPEALEALTFYIVHLVDRDIQSGGAAPKFVFMDEALAFLKNAEIQKFMQHALMRWRHYNAALMIATQSLSHLKQTKAVAMIEQFATRIYAYNPGIDVEEWAEAFQMSETAARIIPTLKKAREVLVQRGQEYCVLTVNVDPVSEALYSNGPYHKEMRARMIEEHGVEDGLKEMAGV